MTAQVPANLIPSFRKREYLLSLSEDNFRDQVVRPLYLSLGLKCGRDTCGITEEGKDCYFFGEDKIAGKVLYAIQTKKGDISLAGTSKKSTNLTNVVTQLRTALETPVKDIHTRATHYPAFVILATSGTINKQARDHIVGELRDPRILFKDAEELIADLDRELPELWNGISVAKIPYLRNFRKRLLDDSQTIDMTELGIGGLVVPPITEDTFATLYLHRYEPRVVKAPAKRDPKSKAPYIGTDTIEKLEVLEIQVEGLLKSSEKLSLVTGDAGAGKTTALRRLAMILTEAALHSKDESRIPVYVTAKELTGPESFIEVATQATKELTSDGKPAFTIDDLNTGNLVVLVDALDEVPDPANRSRIAAKIKDANAKYPNVQVIITSRIFQSIGELAKSNNFTIFYISPISLKQAESMIHRLTKDQSLSKEETQEMLRRLESVHGLELNPLLVTVFVSTSEYSRTDVPANITELFKKYTEMMLGRWNRSKTLGQQYESNVKDMLLCRVAYEMHASKETTISFERLLTVIQTEIDERDLPLKASMVYEELVDHSGLLRVRDGEVFFRHHLLQEFFAGRGIPTADLLSRYATDVWWTKALVFYFGQNADDHVALTALRNGLDRILGADRYQASIVVGLACQACYLMKKSERFEAMKWVVTQLAKEKDNAISHFQKHVGGKLLPFLWYYLYARDAVAAKVIADVASDVKSRLTAAGGDDLLRSNREQEEQAEIDQLLGENFWCLAGLIESHQLEKAEEVIKKFSPTDPRMYLALHSGAYCVEKLHVTAERDRKRAREIVRSLEPAVSEMRPQLISELKGYLLEIRQGNVEVVKETDPPETTS